MKRSSHHHFDLGENANQESFVQVVSLLPFAIKPDASWQIVRLLNLVNLSLATPCFMLDEMNRTVLCRYTFLKPSEEISAPTLMSLLGMIFLYLDVFSELIEEVNNGKTVEEVMANHVDALIKKAA